MVYRSLKNPVKGKCLKCTQDFMKRNWNTKYCDECVKILRISHARKERRKRTKTILRKVCPMCLRMFVITRGDREYCDRICYRKAGRLSTLLKRQKEIQESINTIKAFTR